MCTIVGVSRGNTIRGNRTGKVLRGKSASERVSERISEREGFQRFSVVFRGLRGFERLLRGFQRFCKDPLRDPLRVPFSSKSCGSCCP